MSQKPVVESFLSKYLKKGRSSEKVCTPSVDLTCDYEWIRGSEAHSRVHITPIYVKQMKREHVSDHSIERNLFSQFLSYRKEEGEERQQEEG